MKNLVNTLLVVMFFLTGSNALAQSIHVEWGYTPPSEPAVTGFKLRQYRVGDSIPFQEYVFYGQDITSADVNNTSIDGLYEFRLVATFADGTDSPESSPFFFYGDQTDTCALPITVTTDAEGTHLDYGGCTGITAYKITFKDESGAIIASFTDTDDTAVDQMLPDGSYSIEIQPIMYGTTPISGSVYTASFTANVIPEAPLPPTAALELSGIADATQTMIITPGSDDPDVTLFKYNVYTRDAVTNVKTFMNSYTSNKGAGNLVKVIGLTGKRGVVVEVIAHNPTTGLDSEPVFVVAQLGDVNGDGIVTSADTTAWAAQRTKTCPVWDFNTTDLFNSPLTLCQLADLDHTGLVGNMVSTAYPELNFIKSHLKTSGPQLTTPIAP